MKTVTIKLYGFNELSTKSKERAMDNLYDINMRYEWWDEVYQDAKNAGIKIKSFQLGKGGEVDIQMVANPMVSARHIIENWSKMSDGVACSKKYLHDELLPVYEDSLKEVYLVMLENEQEYLLSEDAIEQAIIGNDYWFTEDGLEYKY